ncbi:glycosyltransferase family 39 protein [Patescibacteria group bacterium]|nr:glycosyltransferase family 39 protein [Patescibacteria group bacterium]
MKDLLKSPWVLIIVIFFGALLRFWNILANDITNDLSINAFRAYGWLDFLVGDGQTSPIVWFGFRPWWSLLSFHDLPPLIMAIQYLSIKLIGPSSLGVLFPFLLSSILVTFFLYYFLKKTANQSIAIIASLIFSISSYSVWAARTGYLEGAEVLFIILAFFLFILFIKTKKNKHFYLFSIFIALAILSKYTSIFLIPSALAYLVIFERKIFKNKHFYLAILSGLILLTPIIIYNIFVFKTKGHFDAALSSMVGMHPQDYDVIAERGVNASILKNLGSIMVVIFRSSSLPLVLVYALSFIFLLIKVTRRQTRYWQNFLAINIVMIILMFSFSGAPPRLLSIINPFLAILAAWFLYRLFILVRNKKFLNYFLIFIFIIFALAEIFYNINTNVLRKPVGPLWLTYSGYRFYNRGFIELEKYIKENIYISNKKVKLDTYKDLRSVSLEGNKIMLFDERLDWFARVWYINRYMLYYKAPLFYFQDIEPAMKQAGVSDVFAYFNKFLDINEFYFVYVIDDESRSNKSQNYIDQMNLIKDNLEKSGINPDREIKDYKGEVIYKIYHFYINN